MKTKLITSFTAILGACALCCLLPIASVLSLSSVLAYLSTEKLELSIVLLVAVTAVASLYIIRKKRACKSENICSTGCGCKPQVKHIS